MNRLIGAAPHATDGDLVRYLDTELSDLEERRLKAHVDECQSCASRLESIGGDSRAFSRYLVEAEAPPIDVVARARALATVRRAAAEREVGRRRLVRGAIAASVVAVLAVSALPVRAWITERWNEVVSRDAVPTVVADAPASAEENLSSVVAFAPRGPRFDLEIEDYQAAGKITIEVREVERATAQTVNGAVETMLVLPSGLRIENSATSRASYVVVVPADLPILRLTVAGETVATLSVDVDSLPWSRAFSLTQK